MSEARPLEHVIEALLFLAPEPVSVAELAEACEASEAEVDRALDLLGGILADGRRGVVLREVAGGFSLAADPAAAEAARRLLAKPRTPPRRSSARSTSASLASHASASSATETGSGDRNNSASTTCSSGLASFIGRTCFLRTADCGLRTGS